MTSPSEYFKMPVIGTITTVSIFHGEGEKEYEVLDIDVRENGSTYMVNAWYKEYKKVPQFIPGVFVKEYCEKEV